MHRPISLPAYPAVATGSSAGHKGIPAWALWMKRLLDFCLAILLILMLLPFLLLVAALVWCTAGRPVLFFQERVGLQEQTFWMIKFRTMVVDAEPDGPRLSCAGDPRITSIGRLLRKWRIDELPQLWNVIKGDMSLVGPRPERAFYRKAIINRLPEYRSVTRIRPGITSLGMVQCGYAENLSELVARARIDLYYARHHSLLLDCRILAQTLRIICLGKGK